MVIILMASDPLNSFKERITKKEKAKYTPPRKPKLIIASTLVENSKILSFNPQ